MPPSTSTRKVAKAARSTSSRRAASGRKNRSLSFPVAMGVIVLLGLLLIFMGRSRRIAAADTAPRVNKDHWHAAYGVYVCDKFIPNLSDAQPDTRGIHTHADGIIHVHPFTSIAAGKNADLGQFFSETNVSVSDGKLVLPGGETWTNGKACPGANGQPGVPGKLVLAEWVDAKAPADVKPRIITHDISSTRFTQDRMAFTLAFVPDDKVASLPKPDSIATLDNLSDVAGSGTSTATTTPSAAGSSSTTAPGTPADQSTTTAPGAAPASTASSAPASTTTTAKSGG